MLEAQVAIFFEGAIDQVFEARRQIGIEAHRRRGCAREDGFENQARGVSAKRQRAGGHFIEDHSERKKIAAGVHFLAANLFGGHVRDGAQRGAGAGEMFGRSALGGGRIRRGRRRGRAGNFGEAEIQNLGVAALGDKDICGFDVAVDDSRLVRGIEGVGDLDGDFQQALGFERAAGDQVL